MSEAQKMGASQSRLLTGHHRTYSAAVSRLLRIARPARPLLSWACALGAAAILVVPLAVPSPLHAERSYVVRSGDTVARIARSHGTTVDNVLAANELPSADRIRPGDRLRIPERGEIFVGRGDTLSGLARTHGVSTAALAEQNRLRENATLRIGQRLLLPGTQPAAARQAAERRYGRARNPGVVEFVRVQSGEIHRVRVTDHRGRVQAPAVRRLATLMRSNRTERRRDPNRRLLANLARVSEQFGGRPIHIVSGYRSAGGSTRTTSRHVSGRAIDFRIPGVPNTMLRDYCRTLPSVGVGYYPRSSFVHLDVRDSNAYWVDWAGPGERARYRRTADGPPVEEEGDSEAAEAEGPAIDLQAHERVHTRAGGNDPGIEAPDAPSAEGPPEEAPAVDVLEEPAPTSSGDGARTD
jgi:uncharacterized protein YcbK (DUF882 family)